MALNLDPPSNNFKHFCKICKKGFMCGRALGGHMRAHGIGDDAADFEDEDDGTSDWEDKMGDNNADTPPGSDNKRMYALRTNPNRMRSCRACENCGKEFFSWKSFLEHRRCGSEGDDAESLVSYPSSDDESSGRAHSGWSKRKRTSRAEMESFPLTEEEDLANCLMMLSNATTRVEPAVMTNHPQEPSASARKDAEERRQMANFITARAPPQPYDKAKGIVFDNNNNNNNNNIGKGMFECKACKKVFNSHQALGGHRASHKKVKGCFAARPDEVDPDRNLVDDGFLRPLNDLHVSKGKAKAKVHECSICHRVFSSGQALGGHKRFHWITPSSSNASTLARFQQLRDRHVGSVQENEQPTVDLNVPSSNVLSLNVSTEFFLQPWGGADKNEEQQHRNEDVINLENQRNIVSKTKNDTNNNSFGLSQINVDNEADSKVKLAKLSELKDMTTVGGSSPWLQVGIGSTNGSGEDL